MSSLFCHRGLQEHVVAGGVNPELDPHRITKAGNNAFHDAVKCGTNPLAVRVQILLRLHSVLSYKPNNKGDTPLHVAARLGNESFAMVLIDHAREPCHINDYTSLLKKVNHVGNTALHEAVLNGHFKIVERLIDEDPTLTNLVNNAGESPLFLAVDRGFYDIASIILDTFPICSLLGRKGMNFMHAAVIRLYDPGNLVPTMIRENCYKGEDEFGWKPLHYAASMGHSRVVKLFLEAKKSLAYNKDKQGMTALHIAARNGHLGVIRKLMNECPDIGEVLDNGNRSALHIAVEHKKVHVAHTLLNNKAFIDVINEQDCKGNTALHVAAVCGYYEIFVSLASNSRTDKRIMNEMGMTALDIIDRSNLLGNVEKAIIKFKINTESNLLSLHEAAIVNQSTKSDEKIQEIQPSIMTNESVPKEEIIDKEVKQMADINLVVSTLITDITFQAAISMAGAATYSSSSSLEAFTLFTAFNSLAFSFSAASMIIHIAVALYFKLLGKPHRYPFTLTMILTIASITLSVLAFFTGTKALLYEKKSKIVSSSNIWDIDFPEKITFFAFLAILIWVLLPLVFTTLYHLIILSSDEGLPLLLFEFKYGVLHYLQINCYYPIPCLPFSQTRKGTPLHLAAKLGNESFAVVLIDHAKTLGHDSDYRNLLRKVNYEKENTALHEAVINGQFEIAKRLIREDPTLTSLVNKAGESPLFLAVEGRFYEIASIILDTTFPHCSLLGGNGMTVMHAAVIRSCPSFDARLLSRNVTRAKDFDEFVKKVLERCGSQILEKAEDELGWTPLHYAANLGHSTMVKLFLKAKRSVAYIKDKQGMTALHIAARKGHIEVMKELMEECSDIGEILDNKDRTALHIAAEHNCHSVVHTLVKERAFTYLINEQDNEGNTALHVAAIHSRYGIMNRLTSNTLTNKRMTNKMGMTAFEILLKSSNFAGFIGKFIVRLELRLAKNKDPLLSLQDTGYGMVKNHGKNEETSGETQIEMTQSCVPIKEDNGQDVQHMQNMNLVVSTLIAGITFQAAITMPGAAQYKTKKGLKAFKDFMEMDSLAFGFSAGSLLIHFIFAMFSMISKRKFRYPTMVTILFIFLSIFYFVFAFIIGTNALLYEKKELNSLLITKKGALFFSVPGNYALAAFYLTIGYVFFIIRYLKK
ncbi:hypothetical protein G4B88_026650 [Cannabis sativa]|uniref:PGG domain-containing protein n=1 Tax=Cannabis sativa TaxID=3483 RepID=A0A7J6DPC6_CANSA|nr:hypothetical protein G4B88_026650 [Cannabis sativa]